MNFLKYFLIFLSFGISAAIYGAYYISNISDLKIDVKVGSGEILKEQQLFAKYNINEEVNTSDSDKNSGKNSEKYEIFKKEAPELKIIRTSFDKDKNFNPEDKIIISFGEEVDIYSLLGFKKVINGEYTCNGKTLKSDKKAIRCNSENKIFITKIGENGELEEKSIFKGVIKKSNIDKKTILISTKIEEFQEYELKILKSVKSFKINKLVNEENKLFSELKKDFIINFTTTDKDGNLKPEEVEFKNEDLNENSGTGEIISENQTGTGEIAEENIEIDNKEADEWMKQKENEILIKENKINSGFTATGETN